MSESQPATVLIDSATKKRTVMFFHRPLLPDGSEIKNRLPLLSAYMLELWWSDPKKYSVDGYDDALLAMRRVFETREWLIGVIKGRHQVKGDARRQANSVSTKSLHIASVIRACERPLITFDKGTFIFGPDAAPIAALIEAVENTGQSIRVASKKVAADIWPEAEKEPDTCVDWMLWALKYHDWLLRIVRAPGCIPLVEKRDGERALRISANMPKTLRREFTRRF